MRVPLAYRFRLLAAALALPALAACSDQPTTAEDDSPPVITVTGVEDGASYDGPVTLTIAVDRGSYTATLNGQALVGSTHTVGAAGDYELRVQARAGSLVSEREVRFAITAAGPAATRIRVLNLGPNDAGGGGDAVLVTDSAGGAAYHMLIDAGPAGEDGADEGYVARRLQALGIDTLEALVLTHAHADHFGGMDEVLQTVHVRRFIYNGQLRSLGFYTTVVGLARARADTVLVPDSIFRFRLSPGEGGSEVTALAPLPTYLDRDTDAGDELNEGSVGVVLRKGDGAFRMFLTGDGEVEANTRWRTRFADLTGDLDILKVGHHGANNAVFDNGFSGASAWLRHTSPEVALISANGTTHARRNALGYLLGLEDLRVLCTNVHGELDVRVGEGGAYEVLPERNPAARCEAGSEATTALVPPR